MRHGETKYQEKKIPKVYTEEENPIIPLTERSKRNLKKIAKELKEKNIDVIYSSPYKRTRQTAEIVAEEISKDIVFDKRLIDIKLGVLHGRSVLGYYKTYLKNKSFSNKPEKGENWRDVQKRVIDFIKEIDNKYTNKKILIVSHGDPVWFLAGFLKGIKGEELFLKRGKYFGKYKGFYASTSQYIEI